MGFPAREGPSAPPPFVHRGAAAWGAPVHRVGGGPGVWGSLFMAGGDPGVQHCTRMSPCVALLVHSCGGVNAWGGRGGSRAWER